MSNMPRRIEMDVPVLLALDSILDYASEDLGTWLASCVEGEDRIASAKAGVDGCRHVLDGYVRETGEKVDE